MCKNMCIIFLFITRKVQWFGFIAVCVISAPYVKLDMNPFLPGVDERAVYKDAMFFSVHKFIGGVQTPGSYCALLFLFLCLLHN
jgi:hypothetical protein